MFGQLVFDRFLAGPGAEPIGGRPHECMACPGGLASWLSCQILPGLADAAWGLEAMPELISPTGGVGGSTGSVSATVGVVTATGLPVMLTGGVVSSAGSASTIGLSWTTFWRRLHLL